MIDPPSESGTQGQPPKVKQRVVGGTFFGFLVGGYSQNAAAQTLPAIIGMIQRTDLEAAKRIYDDSSFYRTSVLVISTFLGAAVAGFLARRRGILAGILSSSPYISVAAYILLVSVGQQYSAMFSRLPLAEDLAGDSSLQSQILLRFILFVLAASLGGLIGQKLYAPEIDLDLGHAKVTIFGVRWAHYFWILPFIYLAFLASALMIVYAGIAVLLADLSLAWHPSLWFFSSWVDWGFVLGPILVWLALWITGVSLVRFYEVMQHCQSRFKGWKKAGRVFLYGVGAPAISYTIAALGAGMARAMPKPVEGDWKIAVGIMLGIMVIGVITSTISRIRATRLGGCEVGGRRIC